MDIARGRRRQELVRDFLLSHYRILPIAFVPNCNDRQKHEVVGGTPDTPSSPPAE